MVVLFALLHSNKAQNIIADEAAKSLSKKLDTEVSIGNVRYKPFNTFQFEDLFVQDLNKDTLLYVHKTYADFDFWNFFKGKFVFNQIELDGLEGNLIVDSVGVSNLDFVLEAFRKPKKEQKGKESSPVEFNFKDIKITNSSFKLYNLQHPDMANNERFNGSRLAFKDINAKIAVDLLKGDSLAATIHSLSAKERSGLTLENLKTKIYGYRTGFRFPNLSIKLPNSQLEMDSVKMEYDSISGLKDILNSVRWNAVIKPSKIALNDLSPFVPNFSNLKDPVSLQGRLNGRISSFRLKDLEVKYRNSINLKANIDLNGIPNINETFIYADVKDFRANKGETQDFISKITQKPFILPKELTRLGTIKYNGNITGFFSNLVAFGNITTDVGTLKTDILLQFENNMRDVRYNGTAESKSFQLGTLLANKALGKTAFKINTKGSKLHNRSLQGTVKGTVPEIFLNKYIYRNINLDGNYDGTGFDGHLAVNDKNLAADFNGVVDMTKKLPVFDFDLLVNHANLNALKLTDKYEGSSLAFYGNTSMVGNSLDNLNGFLLFDSIYFANAGKELAMQQLLFESQVKDGNSRFTITSDLVNGYFDGNFKYSSIPDIVASVMQPYLPALTGQNGLKKRTYKNRGSHIDIDLVLKDTKLISDVLELPFTLDGVTTISGFVDDENQDLSLDVATPFLSFGKRTIQNVALNFDNEGKRLKLDASGNYTQKETYLDFNLKANALNDSLYTQLEWHNQDSVVNAGELQFNTLFAKENNRTSALMTFLPTQVVVFDSIWNVHSSQIAFNPDTTFDVRNFRLQNKDQYIVIDGLVSKKETDQVQVEMNDIDLGFIMDLVNLKPISIKGRTTGIASLYGILKQPAFEANLQVKNTLLNDASIGDAYIYSGWDNRDNELLVSGTFIEGNDTVALANGLYSASNDSIDFMFDTHRLNLGFLQRYIKNIVQDVDAKGTGLVRMYGNTKNIGFEGNVLTEDASLNIGFLNTTYSFRDSIYLTRETIEFKDIKIYDKEQNQGNLNGLITHDGSFKNMDFDIKINIRNMLALDTKPADSDFFYGKAYATGNVHIFGGDGATSIDVNAVTQPRTKMNISVGGTAVANENDFITFVNRQDTAQIVPEKPVFKSSNLALTLLLDVTQNADIQLIINPASGDMISANGSGNLRLEHNSNNGLRLYGGYTIEKGNFLFTLQNLIRKQFRIDEGSSITWSGNPGRAQLDIRAIHSLTASLYDLMSSDILASTDRTSVPVEAILYLTDELTQPTIRFDVNLPSSDETLKMQVRNLMNTEEMMNRQMVYLLLFGKFYTPDYNRTDGNFASNFGSALSSLLSSTGIGQLNSWLSQFSSNVSLGFNWRNTGYGSSLSNEYEVPVMFQPNNRFIINGNFGYRDDNFSKNKIIGDLDLEYILTENSKWRLKAYNHTVDRYSLRAAPFIQGVGIMYKENFNKWSDLWKNHMKDSQKKKPEKDSTSVETSKIDELMNDSLISTQIIHENKEDTLLVGNVFAD